MTQETKRIPSLARGANNQTYDGRLPEGFARRIVNMNPQPGGSATLRPGYQKVMEATHLRLAVPLAKGVVYVDGDTLGWYDDATATPAVLRDQLIDGPAAGVAHAGQVYVCTLADSYRTDGQTVKRWAIPAPALAVDIIPGSLPAGLYKVALVALGDDGEESGADPQVVRVEDGEAIRVVSTDTRSLRVFCSVENGATLFNQGPLIGGAVAINKVDDNTNRLATDGYEAFPFCEQLASYHGVILGVVDHCVLISEPMVPHLYNPVRGFLQFPAKVKVVAPTDGGVFIVADATYFLTNVETGQVQTRKVMNIQALEGSGVPLPDGRAAWFTEYGLVIGAPDGSIELLNKANYAPSLASDGVSGLVEYNGASMVVTAMHGTSTHNDLALSDFAELETGDGT